MAQLSTKFGIPLADGGASDQTGWLQPFLILSTQIANWAGNHRLRCLTPKRGSITTARYKAPFVTTDSSTADASTTKILSVSDATHHHPSRCESKRKANLDDRKWGVEVTSHSVAGYDFHTHKAVVRTFPRRPALQTPPRLPVTGHLPKNLRENCSKNPGHSRRQS